MQGQPADIREWWRYLHDPYLDRSIDQLLQQNLTLRQAGQRIIESRARLMYAKGNLFPQTQTATGVYSHSRISNSTANFFSQPGIFVPTLSPDNFSTGFNANWELDFWGRFRRLIEAADANLEASVAVYDDATVLLLAEFANTYVQMRTHELRINLVARNLELQRKTLEIAKQKRQWGVASVTDVAQAESNFGQTGSQLPELEILRRQACHRMCVLLGREPVDLAVEFGATAQIPQPSQDLAFGIPADLIRQRPDVRKAERDLAAQSARIGVAVSDFYPHIVLNGAIGVSSQNFNQLFEPHSWTGLIAPSFSWNILNYGRIRNNVVAERAVFARLDFAYRQSILNALREAEDAQVSYVYSFDRANWLTVAVNGAVTAVEQADKTFQGGTTESGRVYILQSNLLRQQEQLAVARLQIVASLIDIFKAMGGGWQVRLKDPAVPNPQAPAEAGVAQPPPQDGKLLPAPDSATGKPVPPPVEPTPNDGPRLSRANAIAR